MGLLDVPPRTRPDRRVLIDTNFNDGLGGFVQLTDRTMHVGVLGLDTDRTDGNSRYSMLLSTEDQAWGKTPPWAWSMCTAIKRMGRGDYVGRLKLDVDWAWGSVAGPETPRGVRFCIDQSTPQGVRKYYMFQYLIYDDAAGARAMKWQVLADRTAQGGANRTWMDIPGGAVELGFNENKRGMWHSEFVFDLQAGRYDGLRINGTGLGGGSLSDGYGMPAPISGSNPIRALGGPVAENVPVEGIDSFASGLNITIDLVNRLNTATSKAMVHVARCRAEILP